MTSKILELNNLIKKAKSIIGYSINDIAKKIKFQITDKVKKNKGCIGYIIEKFLGAYHSNKATIDFPNIGIELKTIPINKYGYPKENTFVCMAPLVRNTGVLWETSYVCKKLSSVLWIPIESNFDIPLKNRRIGYPKLWIPNKIEKEKLKNDWNELMKIIIFGNICNITSDYGVILMLKKKYSNNNIYTQAVGFNGKKIMINPLAFYLRKKFTNFILNN